MSSSDKTITLQHAADRSKHDAGTRRAVAAYAGSAKPGRTLVVIPNYNGLRFLPDCMEALARQTVSDFSVLVIDNASGPEDIAWLQHWQTEDPLHHRLLLNEENLGFSGAVNQGIQCALAEGFDFTLLLNNDTRVRPDFLEALEARMDRDVKGRIFALSSKMVKMHDPSKIDDAGDAYTLLGWQFQRGLGENADRPAWTREAAVFSACAGAAMYRSTLFRKVGLFDEHHFAYLEDIDVSFRAQLYGYQVHYCPTAVVEHVGSGTSGSKYNAFKVRLSARNSIYLLYKNMPFPMLVLNILPLLLGFLIKQIFFHRKGFGREYAEGLREGLRTRRNLTRANLKEVPLLRYLSIELRLILQTLQYVLQLGRKYRAKAHG